MLLPTLLFALWMTLHKFSNLFVFQFPYLQKGANNTNLRYTLISVYEKVVHFMIHNVVNLYTDLDTFALPKHLLSNQKFREM